jgi:hypothetical protein
VLVLLEIFLHKTTSVGTVMVLTATFSPRPIWLFFLFVSEFLCGRIETEYPYSLAPQPKTLPPFVLTKLLRPPVAIWITSMPFSAGISKSVRQNISLSESVDSVDDSEVGSVLARRLDDAYGSLMAFGVNSIDCLDFPSPDGISKRLSPSCPCSFALFVKGCVKARPDDVRASRWSSPADIDVNLRDSTW